MKEAAKKLVAVRVEWRLHRAAVELAMSETKAGRKLTVGDVYNDALRGYLDSAGRGPWRNS